MAVFLVFDQGVEHFAELFGFLDPGFCGVAFNQSGFLPYVDLGSEFAGGAFGVGIAPLLLSACFLLLVPPPRARYLVRAYPPVAESVVRSFLSNP